MHQRLAQLGQLRVKGASGGSPDHKSACGAEVSGWQGDRFAPVCPFSPGDGGIPGDIDLAHVNWGNYDLVVIDESHNFRNKKTPRKDGETRYDRLMRRIIQQGVRTRVLMLSATPVNNRLADLKNQIAFVTEGDETALADHGIPSIEFTVRQAQIQFNRWLGKDEEERTPAQLMDMLGFDYFKLLDLLTIARSLKHIEKYYGTAETGRFPEGALWGQTDLIVFSCKDTAALVQSIHESPPSNPVC